MTSINKRFSDTKFDFENYIKYLVGKDNLIKINYYNALVKKKINENIWKKQGEFFDRLRKIPKCKVTLCTRKSRLDILGEEYHTIKGDDISLALDMIEDCYNDKFDKAIIISGDGDFADLLSRVKKKRKEIEICFFEGCIAGVLLKKADSKRLINKKIAHRFFYREKKKKMK